MKKKVEPYTPSFYDPETYVTTEPLTLEEISRELDNMRAYLARRSIRENAFLCTSLHLMDMSIQIMIDEKQQK